MANREKISILSESDEKYIIDIIYAPADSRKNKPGGRVEKRGWFEGPFHDAVGAGGTCKIIYTFVRCFD